MRIAIIHYHLGPGGVTTVIQNTERALAKVLQHSPSSEAIQTVVFIGPSKDDSPPMPISSDYTIIEELGYNTSTTFSVEQVSTELETVAKQKLGALPDIWHFHNHSLAKNFVVPEIVYHLAQKGHRLLLQMHDFAEDGRPSNYKLLRDYFGDADTLGTRLYPQASHIHYAFINSRDLNFLKASGAIPSQLHYLPNAVYLKDSRESEPEPQNTGERLFLYPVRVIPRKNLGEFLFWSLFAEDGDRFAVTRAPKNPIHKSAYDAWVTFAQSLNLPVEFAFGEQWSGNFVDLLKSAYTSISTSIAEGFGLAFLESWLAGRPLVGRKLPEITNEFEKEGLNLSGLYKKLLIPKNLVGWKHFCQEVQIKLTAAYESYGRVATPDDIERAIESARMGDAIDFGRLDENLQRSVIKYIAREPSLKNEILPSQLEPLHNFAPIVSQNREIVENRYNLYHYGKRLLHLYQTVAGSPTGPVSKIDADRLLDKYLEPERFWLLSC